MKKYLIIALLFIGLGAYGQSIDTVKNLRAPVCEPDTTYQGLIDWHMQRILHWMKVKQGKKITHVEVPAHVHPGKDYKTPDTLCIYKH